MRIGYFGGTFDPPHRAHLRVAQAAAEAFALDQVLLAPGDGHLGLARGGDAVRVRIDRRAVPSGNMPSVDPMLRAVARQYGAGAVAVILSGMGRDGARGLLDIRRAGGFTVAQDEASSVVYGMPREAALIGAAEQVLPLAEIGPALGALPAAPARMHA